MAESEKQVVEAQVINNSLGADEQDLLLVLEQLEIQDLGELALIAWRVI